MAYATVQQFVDQVTEVEARALAPSSPAGGYDASLIGRKLATVSGEMDTYFGVRYPTPLSPVPDTAVDGAIALAREALDRQGRDQVKAEAARVRAWLRDVAKGMAVLSGGVAGEDAPVASSDAGPVYSGPDRVFDDDGLTGFLS
jgi:phage gp36-like protein